MRQPALSLPEPRAYFPLATGTYLKERASDPLKRELLREAIATMSPEALRYKGLTELQEPLVRFLS